MPYSAWPTPVFPFFRSYFQDSVLKQFCWAEGPWVTKLVRHPCWRHTVSVREWAKKIIVPLPISWQSHLFLFLKYDQCLKKWIWGIWHDPFPHSAVGWGNLSRYLGHQLTVFNLKREIGWKKRSPSNDASPIMNRPTKLDVQFSQQTGRRWLHHCFSKESHPRLLPFISAYAWLHKQYPEKVQSRNILANTLADTRPSLAFSAIF